MTKQPNLLRLRRADDIATPSSAHRGEVAALRGTAAVEAATPSLLSRWEALLNDLLADRAAESDGSFIADLLPRAAKRKVEDTDEPGDEDEEESTEEVETPDDEEEEEDEEDADEDEDEDDDDEEEEDDDFEDPDEEDDDFDDDDDDDEDFDDDE